MHEYPFVMLKIEMETPHFSMEKYIKDSIQRAGFSIASLYGNYLSTASWVGFGVGGGFHSPVHIFCLGKTHITKVSRWENSQICKHIQPFFIEKLFRWFKCPFLKYSYPPWDKQQVCPWKWRVGIQANSFGSRPQGKVHHNSSKIPVLPLGKGLAEAVATQVSWLPRKTLGKGNREKKQAVDQRKPPFLLKFHVISLIFFGWNQKSSNFYKGLTMFEWKEYLF